jgi:hypothetical protein
VSHLLSVLSTTYKSCPRSSSVFHKVNLGKSGQQPQTGQFCAAIGATHYARWANLARAVGLRLNRRAKALVAGSYLLLPNLLVPFLDVRCLHIVLVRLVTTSAHFLKDDLEVALCPPDWLLLETARA